MERDCDAVVHRLKNLAERVILTKKSWGFATLGVEELAPLAGYVAPDRAVVYIQPKSSE